MPVKQYMALSHVKYVVNNLMRTRRVARVSYPISGHNLVTGYIMGLNLDRTCSVRLTGSVYCMEIIVSIVRDIPGCA